jgi:hypothetical protein
MAILKKNMTALKLITSPLEQFQIVPILPFYIGFFDFSITNETIILLVILAFSIIYFYSFTKENDSSYHIIAES